jgi:hypothetical protein
MVADNIPSSTLDIYKLCVEMADRTSARRLATNSFFVTLNATLATVVGVVGTVHKSNTQGYDRPNLIILAAVGIILSVAWRALLRYYRRLNHAKFEVINAMEEDFPVKPFTNEWRILHPDEDSDDQTQPRWYQVNERWNRAKHREATVVEQTVPLAFIAIYVALAIRVGIS